MTGMCRHTGQRIYGVAYLAQRVEVLLTTRRATRVMRREYFSELPRLVDHPLNAAMLVDVYACTAHAIARWEPELKLSRVQAVRQGRSTLAVTLEGHYVPRGTSAREPVSLSVVVPARVDQEPS